MIGGNYTHRIAAAGNGNAIGDLNIRRHHARGEPRSVGWIVGDELAYGVALRDDAGLCFVKNAIRIADLSKGITDVPACLRANTRGFVKERITAADVICVRANNGDHWRKGDITGIGIVPDDVSVHAGLCAFSLEVDEDVRSAIGVIFWPRGDGNGILAVVIQLRIEESDDRSGPRIICVDGPAEIVAESAGEA